MNSSIFFGISTVGYILAMIMYISYLVFKKKEIGITATIITLISFAAHTIGFFMRWYEGYQIGWRSFWRPPISNLYESLIFFLWCLILGYIIIEFKYKSRYLGAFITPIAAITLAFIEMTGMSKEIEPLLPALQSNWLLLHVTMSFIAYSLFTLSFATALIYLIEKTKRKTEFSYIFWTLSVGLIFILLIAMGADYIQKIIVSSDVKITLLMTTFRNNSSIISTLSWIVAFVILLTTWNFGYILKKIVDRFNVSEDMLDILTYKFIVIGFIVFTIGGLIFGAVWAEQAWGVYWSWDPKETWSLITWFVYAFYLHARLIRGWKGKKAATLAVVGFVTVIFTYLGVNLLLPGLHSYG